MGGRGAKLDVNTYLSWSPERRTSEYETIYDDGGIKFLVQRTGNRVAAPIFSNTEGRIYVTVNNIGNIKGITKYDGNHREIFSIHEPHLDHPIKEVHVHTGFGKNRTTTYWSDMRQDEKKLYIHVAKKFREFSIRDKAIEHAKINKK